MFSVLFECNYEGYYYTGIQFFPDAELFMIYMALYCNLEFD